MPNQFPGGANSFPRPDESTYTDDPGYELDVLVNEHSDAIEQDEAKIGYSESSAQDTPLANTGLFSDTNGKSKWRKAKSTDIDWSTVPAARAYHNANQSVANATLTALALNSERFDSDTIHDTSTNNSRLTCKTAGRYVITASAGFAANATGIRLIGIRLNGSTYIAQSVTNNVGAGQNCNMEASAVYELAVNDYLELIAYQTSGGALNVEALANFSPELAMARVG